MSWDAVLSAQARRCTQHSIIRAHHSHSATSTELRLECGDLRRYTSIRSATDIGNSPGWGLPRHDTHRTNSTRIHCTTLDSRHAHRRATHDYTHTHDLTRPGSRAHHPLARDRSLQLLFICAPRTRPAFAAIHRRGARSAEDHPFARLGSSLSLIARPAPRP